MTVSEQYKLYGDGIHDDTAALQYLLDNNDGTIGRVIDLTGALEKQ